ncbi:MAG: gamma carbonic anhydrase family protein [Methanosphaera sp.]|uniref:gamma carbonic anhydrase family protein n=1 Tax=Methanosphaera sp. BMS TaxID=1789762 RepID=UPI000DC1F5F5|nr:gamma carbonic anhydrase family protein [Methanosphaera sp. BMS]AWX33197.1 gamma carbonic anhydrase family protein [Methanosphaera sp. BMS]MBQ6444058.1 gamma carbonic anhydrase family protein [Methanosphaera sp.]
MKNKAKIYDGAKVVGDVELKDNVSVWYNAVVRGDQAPISVDENSNIQDNCVVHVSKNYPVKIGKNVSIGHGAIIHGCTIEDNVLIGMGAIILNGAKISKNCLVGAGALVTENKEFPEGSLIIGSPAKAVRQLSEEQIESIQENADEYVNLAFNQ